MNRVKEGAWLPVIALVAGLLLTSCGGGEGNPDTLSEPVTLSSIGISPGNANVDAGSTQAYTATGIYTDGSNQDFTSLVTWNSSDLTIATIDVNGLATGLSTGTSTITATDPVTFISGMTSLIVPATLVSIAVTPLDPSIPLTLTTQPFTATGTYTDSSTLDLTASVDWSSSDTLVATITPSGGVLTTLATGTSTIMATDPVSAISGSSLLTVTPPVMSTIAITPVDPSVPLGSSQQLTATGTLTDGSTQDLTASITWNSSNVVVATVTSPGGLVSTLVEGVTTISYTDPVSLIVASVTLTVVPPVLASIVVTPATPTIVVGNTVQFTATGTYTDASVLDITLTVAWSSTDGAVATVDTTGTIGLSTALTAGTTTITATAGSVNGSTLLTVTPPALVSLAVTPIGSSVPSGDTQQFTAIGTFADASTLDLSASVIWGSSNSSVATIAAGGLATSVGIGTTAITATSGAISDAVSLTVTTSQLVSIAITPISPSIINSGTQAFTATGTFSDGSTQDVTNSVTWSSTDTTIVTVDTSGLATGDAVNIGSVTVLATSGFISGSTAMTVNANTLDSITVTPASPSVVLGGNTISFTATGTYSDMSTADITSAVVWSSSDTTVATIDSIGIATSGISGTTTITATSGVISGTTSLNVALATLASIAVTPSGQTIPLGTTQQFTAIGTYTDSTTQDLTASVTWISSPGTGDATVDANGLATSVAQGTLTITATSGAIVSPAIPLTVGPPALVSIDITPGSPSISGVNTVQLTAMGNYTDASTVDLTNLVTWGSLDGAVATVDDVGTKGLAAGVAAGNTTITVFYSSVNGSTPIIVTVPQLTSIAVTPVTPSIPLGNTQQFTAIGTYSDASTQNLSSLATWTSTPGTGDATVDVNGLATSVGVGTVTITAESFDAVSSLTITGAAVLTVTPAQLVLIDVTPTSPSVAKGNTVQFTAIGTYTDSSTQDLTATATWTSLDMGVATIAAGGLATSIIVGTTDITATSGVVTSAPARTLNVTAAELVSIDLSPLSPSIVQGGATEQFTATGNYTDSTTQDLTSSVTWASSSTAVADFVTTAGEATSGTTGVTTITATLGIISGSTALNVATGALTGITVTPADPSIALGLAQQFTATGSYASGPDQDITGSVSWSSSNVAIATINSGLAVSVAVGGPVTLTATSGSIIGTTGLTVTAKELDSIAVTPVTPSIVVGGIGQFTATGTYTDGSTANITTDLSTVWASSVTAVADFITTPGEVTSATVGNTTITATDGATSGSTVLYVTSSALVSISVTPSNPSVGLGDTQQFIATGTYADSSTADLTTSVTWSLSDPTVASISIGGLVTGNETGTTMVTATSGSVGGSTLLTVTTSSLVSIAVTPTAPSVPLGNTQQFTATGTFSDSSTQNLTSSVTWTSSDTTVATIAANGLATTLLTGTTTITATSGAITDAVTLTVGISELVSISVTPVSPSIALGNTVQLAATGNYTDGSTQDLTSVAAWSSSDPGVATISSGALVTSTGIGTATMSATFNGVIGSTPVSVTTSLLVSIAVTPTNSTVDLGDTTQFTAIGTYTDSSTLDLTSSVTWSSSNESVITIDAGGLAATVSVGKTTIAATTGAVTDSTQLSVLCTVSVPCPRFAYVANRSENTVSIYTVDPNSGQLRHRGHVDTGTSPEAVAVDPGENFVYVANSSPDNSISVYTIDSTGALTAGTSVLAGTDPVSVTIDPNGQFLYVANSTSGDISAYTIDSITGALAPIGTAVLAGTNPVSVTVDPTGQFAYVANSGSDNISVFTIEIDGSLTAGTPVAAETNPYSVAIDPTGQFLYAANLGSDDVSVYTIDSVTGALTAGTPVSLGALSSPISATVDPTGQFVYTANFGTNDVSTFTINPVTGALAAVGLPITAGTNPYAVSVDPSGQFVHVSNFGSNDISVYTIDAATGALTAAGKIRTRTGPVSIAMSRGINAVTYTPQFAYTANFNSVPDVSVYTIDPLTGLLTAGTFATADANPFSVAVDPTGRFAYVANFGANNVSAYTIDSVTGTLTSVGAAVASGVNPRAITVDPTGRFAYVANSGSNTVSVYSIDAVTGVLTPGVAVATDLEPQSVAVDPTGQFAYVANSGADTVSVYTINPVTGALTPGTPVVTGVFPISVMVDPTGQFVYVANFGADTVSAYTINPVTGELTPAGTAVATGTGPNAVAVDPTGQFAYVVNFDSNDLSIYTINPTTGELTASATIATGLRPIALTVDPSGEFAYVVNFDSDDLSIYTVNPLTGSLSSTGTIGAGFNPRSIAISAVIQ